MAKRSSSSTPSRFRGTAGRGTLVTCISESRLLSGNTAAAKEFVAQGRIVTHSSGEALISQGAQDDDVFFLVSGSVQIYVNNRKIAVREACTHLGEMSAMDPTARRSASVVALTETVALAISATTFISIAEKNPIIYRRIAVEVATRLRQRNTFHQLPNDRPVMFIGSSSEGLVTARRLAAALESKHLSVRIWSNDIFAASDTTIESLEQAATEVDFAILVLTPDDTTTSRGKRRAAPRDNVVYELGLFGGALGRKRTFMVVETTTKQKIPTDLLGVTALGYRGVRGITPKSLNEIKESILAAVDKMGAR